MRFSIVIVTIFFGHSHAWFFDNYQKSSPTVVTPLGIIEGFYNSSDGGQLYEAYEGIRFGQSPTGKYRFEMAREVTEPWKGVVKAKSYGPSCLQSGAVPNLQGGVSTDSEDCLFLNVYTPANHCRPKPRSSMWKKRYPSNMWGRLGAWNSNEDEGSDSRDSEEDLYFANDGSEESFEFSGESDLTEDEDSSDSSVHNKVKRDSCSTLPVIIFIHGGAFRSGNTISYRPTYIMNLPVIFVQITYRLGVLGFLSTQDDVVPGNLGLKDQVIAMRWVKRNIKYFGGDTKKITIVGQSAGGASVQYHYLTPATKGLFQAGMSLSGTALNCWTETEVSREKAKRLGTLVNCPTNDMREMIDCMKNRSATQLVQASNQFSSWVYNPITPFGPTVEKWNGKGKPGEFIMIHRHPYQSLIKGEAHKLPWITSTVSQDGLFPAAEFLANKTLLKQLNDHWDTIAPVLLDYNYTVPRKFQPEVSEIIRKHYFGDRPIDTSTVDEIVRMVTDRLFKSDAELAAKLQSKIYDGVWFYDFGYRQNHSLSDTLSNTTTNWGVAHLDDLAYILDAFFNSTTTAKDRKMQNFFFKLWYSFATKKEPQVGVYWDKVKPVKNLRLLRILGPDKIFMDKSSDFGEEHFWHFLRFNENENSELFPDE